MTGVDLSPIQPDWVPPNCKFELDDLELPWTWPTDTYDFVHARNLLSSIKDVPKLVGQIYSRLKPGGYVQFGEFLSSFSSDDDSIPENWPPSVCTALSAEAFEKMGLKFWSSAEVERFSRDAGFVDVKV